MKPIQFFIIFVLSSSLFSQSNTGLVLEYDIYNDEVTYKRDGLVTNDVYIKSGENIKVKVTEFNPYISKATIRVDQINYSQSSAGMNAGNAGPGGFSMDGIAGLLGGFGMGSEMGNAFAGIPGSRGMSSEQIMEIKSEYRQLASQLKSVEQKINSAHEKLELFRKVEKSKALALADISALKKNQNIQPSRIKKLIQEEINYAFAKKENESIDINDLVDEMQRKQEIDQSIDDYKKASKEYQKLSKDWRVFQSDLALIEGDDADRQLEHILSNADEMIERINENAEKFSKIKLDKDTYNYNQKQNDLNMAQLRQVYEEMKGDNFSYSFAPIQAEGDEVVIEIRIFKIDEFGSYNEEKNLKQSIPITGGWKLSGGLGLCFGKFNNETYAYNVSESTIVADKKDEFIPIVSSMGHFTKRTHKNISYGASFGLGLPIVGGGGSSSPSFFLGPTIVLGKNQKFLISGGVMGAKAERLAGGLEVGDLFFNSAEFIPTTKSYELGYFIGISYSILK